MNVWVARVVALTRWVGVGRKVTQTGRVTLADARILIGVVGTDDVVDPTIGGRVFRTRTSEELPILNTVVEWAKASRLVRVAGGKLVPVAKNARLLERPDALWQRMFEVFGKLGPAICPAGWGESLLRHRFDTGMAIALAMLHERSDPVPLDEICAQVWLRISAGYRIGSVPQTHLDTWRRCCDRDVKLALAVLAEFGAVRMSGSTEAPSAMLTLPAGSSVDAR